MLFFLIWMIWVSINRSEAADTADFITLLSLPIKAVFNTLHITQIHIYCLLTSKGRFYLHIFIVNRNIKNILTLYPWQCTFLIELVLKICSTMLGENHYNMKHSSLLCFLFTHLIKVESDI